MAGKRTSIAKVWEWDVNNPASADGFTVIFNKARNEKRSSGYNPSDSPPKRGSSAYNNKRGEATLGKPPQSKKWLCCMHSSAE